MLYRKNVGAAERAVRLVLAVAMVVGGLWGLGLTPLGLALAGGGAVMALTAFAGFCPACAMVGRRPVEDRR